MDGERQRERGWEEKQTDRRKERERGGGEGGCVRLSERVGREIERGGGGKGDTEREGGTEIGVESLALVYNHYCCYCYHWYQKRPLLLLGCCYDRPGLGWTNHTSYSS